IAALAAEVSIDEWDVPTENSRPHDPAVAPDGALWFTEQRANKLGRLDPRTGQMKEFPLPTPGSGPHGLVADREGNIWFTAISKGYVGKLDPKTGSVKEYPTGDRRARDPHTPVFDQRGRLWFTLEQSNFIGRLDPRSSEMRLAEGPSPGGAGARPYGIAVTPDGTVWYSESGLEPNTLVRFDPRTKKFSSTPILSGGGVVRNMVATSDGRVYLAESGVNKVAIAHVSI